MYRSRGQLHLPDMGSCTACLYFSSDGGKEGQSDNRFWTPPPAGYETFFLPRVNFDTVTKTRPLRRKCENLPHTHRNSENPEVRGGDNVRARALMQHRTASQCARARC